MESYKGFALWEVVYLKPGFLPVRFDYLTGQIVGFFTVGDFDGSDRVYLDIAMAEPLIDFYPPGITNLYKMATCPNCLLHLWQYEALGEPQTPVLLPPKKNKPKTIAEVLAECRAKR